MGQAEWYMRQAHNLKVAGSNPAPATNHTNTFLIWATCKSFFEYTVSTFRDELFAKYLRYDDKILY